jgi:hypothetical protein
VTGEIERRTSFEGGFPGMEAYVDGSWSAISQFTQELPKAFVLNTVGTRYVF